jgi:hypothetical protein
LLFAGTEFGVHFTVDGGGRWIRLQGGIPTICVRDLAIQRRRSDLVSGTFGRGIYILDDYTPLRVVTRELLERDAMLFSVKDALHYIERSRLSGAKGRGSQGASFFTAENPPFGAVFTYYLREKITTRKERRKEAEKSAAEEGRPYTYPSLQALQAEDREEEPQVVCTVRDRSGRVVRRLTGPREAGVHRVAWDLRYSPATPTKLEEPTDRAPWSRPPTGPLAPPGTYEVTLATQIDGEITELAPRQRFEVVPLKLATFAAEDPGAVAAFHRKVARLRRAILGAIRAADAARNRLAHLGRAFVDTPGADPAVLAEIHRIDQRLDALLVAMRGDPTLQKRQEPEPPSIRTRVENIVSRQWHVTSAPTRTHEQAYQFAGKAFAQVLAELHVLIEQDLGALEDRMEAAGAPWTPGRLPTWEPE